jgi:predicted DNA-binding transcriptional regulator YafY
MAGGEEQEVVIRFDEVAADYVREKRWHPSQRLVELKDGGVELRLRLSSLTEVHRWVLSWGGQAVPVSPPRLVEMARAAAARLGERLRGSTGAST